MGTHWISDACTSCGACAEVCPENAISESSEIFVIDKEACTDCGACETSCPVDAIKF